MSGFIHLCVFKVHPCCSRCQCVTLSYGFIRCHCTDKPPFKKNSPTKTTKERFYCICVKLAHDWEQNATGPGMFGYEQGRPLRGGLGDAMVMEVLSVERVLVLDMPSTNLYQHPGLWHYLVLLLWTSRVHELAVCLDLCSSFHFCTSAWSLLHMALRAPKFLGRWC